MASKRKKKQFIEPKDASHRRAFNKQGLYNQACETRQKCTGFSIDGVGTKLLDDGLNLKKHIDGSWTLEFFIADVVLFYESVGDKPSLDQVGRNIPQVSRETWLKNFGLKSTQEQVSKPAIRITMNFKPDVTLTDYSIDRVIFENKGPLFFKDIEALREINPEKWAERAEFATKLERRYIKNEIGARGLDLVETCAAFTNGILAQYAYENELPVFYAKQVFVIPGINKSFKSEASVIDYIRRESFLVQGEMPKRDVHYELQKATLFHNPSTLQDFKLPVYAKFTSPMQRVSDAINLLAVVNHVLGRPQIFTRKEIQSMSDKINNHTAQRRKKKYPPRVSRLFRENKDVVTEQRESWMKMKERFKKLDHDKIVTKQRRKKHKAKPVKNTGGRKCPKRNNNGPR